MKSKLFLNLFFLGCLLIASTNSYSQDANDLLKKMEQLTLDIKDKSSNIKMTMINLKTNKEKVKRGVVMQKDGNKKLFRYTFPKSDEGIATLSLPNGEIYLYLPLFKKPKKITNLAESNMLNKSDFSIGDMATSAYSKNYNAKLIETTDTLYILDLTSSNEDLTYNHIVIYLNKEYYYPEKMEYFGKKDELEKIATSHYIKIDGFWIADEVTMETVKKKHKTTIVMTDTKINQGLNDDEFTVEKLKDSIEN